MPEYLLITRREIRCEIPLQAPTVEEAREVAQRTSFALDHAAFSTVASTSALYEMSLPLTDTQRAAAIAELIHFGYEDITERILRKRQASLAEFKARGWCPEDDQEPDLLCVLYKEGPGVFYCYSSAQLVLKLMEERAACALLQMPDPCLEGIRFAGNPADYNPLITQVFQGETYIAVVEYQGTTSGQTSP